MPFSCHSFTHSGSRLARSPRIGNGVSGREMEGALMTVVFGVPGTPGVERSAKVDSNNVAQLKASCS